MGFADVARSWRRHWGNRVVSMLILSMSFTLITAFWNLTENVSRILVSWGESTQMTVYLQQDVEDERHPSVEKSLRTAVGEDTEIEYVSRRAAYESFRQQVKTYAPALGDDEDFETALPASFHLRFPQIGSGERFDFLSKIATRVGSLSGVQDVSYGQGWVENFRSFSSGLASVGYFILGTLLLAAMVVVAHATQTTVHSKREEIEVLELLGATAAMIRTPFVLEGAILGGLSAGFAVLMNYGLHLAQLELVQNSWAFMGVASQIQGLGVLPSLVVLVGGTMLGAGAAWLVLLRLNRGWSAAERTTR